MTLPFGQVSFPELFEQELVGPLFQPFAEQMVEKIDPHPGDVVLDVGCGTGIVARLAYERMRGSGKVVGVDLSPAMIAVARKIAPQITWREGDAAALPLESGEVFDVVTCQQGLQFFPDRAAGVREMHRALGAGGRLAVSTWRADDEVPFGRQLRAIAERHVGPILDRRHSFGELQELASLVSDAGFTDVNSEVVHRTVRFENPRVFPVLNAMALIGMSDAAKTLSEAERIQKAEQIVDDSASVIREFSDENGLAFDISTNLVTARRPAA